MAFINNLRNIFIKGNFWKLSLLKKISIYLKIF